MSRPVEVDEPATFRHIHRVTATLERFSSALAGRYRIERELGAGGMAKVFLARDLRHERPVALKVLDPELGAVLGGERFLAEIRVTANLHHPHLLPLYDSGEADGLLFYVMPYVEGESLRQRIDREKQLPVDEAVRIAVDVAAALDYAHRQGVIHRDLKPDNILLKDGEAMISDFGIALAISKAGGTRVTQTGLSLGTPQYMSPEQATGDRALDARTDIYSLAAVLYEMLVGDAPHPGSTAQVIIAKVLAERPTNVRVLRPAVPAQVAAAVEKALEKFPADRWPTAREFADALTTPAAAAPTDTLQVATEELRAELRRRHRWPASRVAIGSVMVLAVIAAVGLWQVLGARRDAEPPGAVRFTLAFEPNERVAMTMGSTVAISPSGEALAYAGVGSGGLQQLFVRTLDEIRARPLPGTEDAERPFFSPDGQWLGFVTRGRLRKVPVGGGSPIALPELSHINGASWGRNDVMVISSQNRLVTTSANGGPVRVLTQLDTAAGETGQRWPRFLADGKTLLYTSWRTGLSDARIAVVSLETGRTTALNLEGTFPLGVLDGQLIYASGTGAIMAVPFDARRLRLTGTPKVVVEQIVLGADGAAHAELAPSGSLIYQVGRPTMRLIARDARGNARTIIDEPRQYQFPRFSPDGSRIALTVVSENSADVWTFNIASGTLTRLTTEGTSNDRPEWTPDGKRIIYSSNRGDGFALWWQPADGSGRAEPLAKIPGKDLVEGVLSPDQQWVVYRSGQDIWARRLAGDSTPRAVATGAAFAPRVSPDGHWVAYSSEESGVAQVYVRPFPELGARYQVSIDGGTEPVWSHDGRRLYYRRNRVITAATLSTTPAFTVTAREDLFEGDFVFQAVHAEYDVAPDGRQFLLPQFVGDHVQTIVVQNWSSELRSRTVARQ